MRRSHKTWAKLLGWFLFQQPQAFALIDAVITHCAVLDANALGFRLSFASSQNKPRDTPVSLTGGLT